MNEEDFSRLPPAAQAYIRELEARNLQMGERIAHLEEQFRLAQSKRFAPSSEKLQDRVFDEAEQIAAIEPDDDDADDAQDTFVLPDTGLPDAPTPACWRRHRPDTRRRRKAEWKRQQYQAASGGRLACQLVQKRSSRISSGSSGGGRCSRIRSCNSME